MSDEPQKKLTLQELPDVRRRTEGIARLLRDELEQHLKVFQPLLAPERLLGKAAGARADAPDSERHISAIRHKYKDLAAAPYNLAAELESHWLTLVGNRLDLQPWEYIHEATDQRETKAITMTSTVRWILCYKSDFTVLDAKKSLAGKQPRNLEHLRQFALNALVLEQAFASVPGLPRLFSELRYEIKTDFAPDLGRLPLVTITSCLPSFRPPDDLILAATGFSGVPAFIELVDVDAVRNLKDPLKQRIEALL